MTVTPSAPHMIQMAHEPTRNFAPSHPRPDWFAVLRQCGHQRVDDGVYRALGGRHALLQLANPLIAHQPAQQIFLQNRCRPLTELHAANRIDTVSNGNNRRNMRLARLEVRRWSEGPSEWIRRIRRGSMRRSLRPPPHESCRAFPHGWVMVEEAVGVGELRL